MAADIYLKLEGIEGESTDHVHRGWVECASVAWAIGQLGKSSGSAAGGHTIERSDHQDIILGKVADRATPLLLQACSAGATIPSAQLDFMRADSNGQRVKYFEVKLENVLVAVVLPTIAPGELLHEQVGLRYAKISWRYSRQSISGGLAGCTVGGWDLSRNRTC